MIRNRGGRRLGSVVTYRQPIRTSFAEPFRFNGVGFFAVAAAVKLIMVSLKIQFMFSPYFIGIDIGGTKMAVSIFDVTTAKIERVERFPSGPDCDPQDAVSRMAEIAQHLDRAKRRTSPGRGGFGRRHLRLRLGLCDGCAAPAEVEGFSDCGDISTYF